ncbi:MAG: large conductance mechanosensitive channel protein MscL [Gammaproteobacteria bacterium]
MLEEFKKFAMRGNVVDMAVGIIIGGAFGKIVTSLVNDVVMPPIGKMLGGVDFKDLFINIGSTHYATLEEAHKAGAATINYGLFINTVLDFLIVAFVIFMVIQGLTRLRKKEAPETVTTKNCPECLSEIPLAAKRCKFCASPTP